MILFFVSFSYPVRGLEFSKRVNPMNGRLRATLLVERPKGLATAYAFHVESSLMHKPLLVVRRRNKEHFSEGG